MGDGTTSAVRAVELNAMDVEEIQELVRSIEREVDEAISGVTDGLPARLREWSFAEIVLMRLVVNIAGDLEQLRMDLDMEHGHEQE
jgi:hypothetical protein